MATFSRIIKKAASSVIPLANRTSHRNFSTAIFSTPLKASAISTSTSTNLFRQVSRTNSIPTYHHLSTLSKKRSQAKKTSNPDDILLSAIKSEIDDLEVSKAPRDFPFKIVDDAKKKGTMVVAEKETITLTRDYQDEEIEVTVDLSGDGEEESQHEEGSQDDEKMCFGLTVRVFKTSRPILEFGVVAEADGIRITYAAAMGSLDEDDFSYESRDFKDLDETMQEAFRTFLDVRGINPSMTEFLCNYMDSEDQKEYIEWLKKFERFYAH